MSYIAFDLDALNAVPHVARASAIDEARITHGLVHLWAHCFRAKVDHITRIHLLGFFGADVADALEAFGFLEKDGTAYRVKGASRYLRIATGRSEGGKKSAGNLIPGARQKKAAAENIERGSRETLSAASRLPLGSVSAPSRLALGLSPTTDDRRPTTEYKSTVPAFADTAAEAPLLSVQEKPTRRAPKEKPTDDRHAPLVKALCDAYERITGIRYKWQGGKDAAALSGLLAHEGPERIREVWEFGVAADPGEWASCRTVAALASKWNDLAAKMPPPSYVPPCSVVGCEFDASEETPDTREPCCQKHFYGALAEWQARQGAGVAS